MTNPPNDPEIRAKFQAHQAEILKALVEKLWALTLKGYDNGQQLKLDLGEFISHVSRLDNKYRLNAVNNQLATSALYLRDNLGTAGWEHDSIERLNAQIINLRTGSSGHGSLKLILAALRDVLSTRLSYDRITQGERDVLQKIEDVLKKLQFQKTSPEVQQIGQTIFDQLPGSLSKNLMAAQFPSDHDRVDWSGLVAAAQSGQINDLLASGQMVPYLQVLLENSQVPMVDKLAQGVRVPISDSPRDVETALDLHEMSRFVNQGTPFPLLLPNLVQGNVLKWKFFDVRESQTPRETKPRIAHYINIDVSGSMHDQNKWVTRNLALNSYIDYYSQKMAAEEEDHIFVLIYFEGTPHKEQVYRGFQQIQNLFAALRSAPAGAGGGTSITNTWVRSLNLARQEIEQNGALDAVNILLLSDGIDHINEASLLTARNGIPKDVRLAFNAISVLDHNPEIEKIVKKFSTNPTALGKMAYHHIDRKSIAHISSYADRFQKLKAISADNNNSQNGKVTMMDLTRLTQMINGLPFEEKMETQMRADHKARLLEYLEPENLATKSSLPSLENLWKFYFEFYDFETCKTADWEFESLITFVRTTCTAAEVTPQQLFSSLNLTQRERVKKWLK